MPGALLPNRGICTKIDSNLLRWTNGMALGMFTYEYAHSAGDRALLTAYMLCASMYCQAHPPQGLNPRGWKFDGYWLYPETQQHDSPDQAESCDEMGTRHARMQPPAWNCSSETSLDGGDQLTKRISSIRDHF